MTELNDNTIRLDNISSGIKSGDTIKIPDENNIVQKYDSDTIVNNSDTLKVDDVKKIPSGLSDKLSCKEGSENVQEFNGVKYRILKKISETTAEAQIYLLANGDEKYILKYYYPFVKPKIEIIEKVRGFSHPDIIKVVDYGYYEERFYEILVYADQGSLADHIPIKDIKLIKRYIKEIAGALNHCHNNKIIHRDIKPSNIFIKDEKKKDVVVGDFGIASILENEEELRRTNIFQTPIYAAPEYKMTIGGETVISKAVDYYALGITVWEMWSGKLPPNKMDDLEFLRLMFEGIPPLPADMNEEVAHLIKGLTTRNYKKRWGYKEIQKWLKGENVEVFSEEIQNSSKRFYFGKVNNGEKLYADNPKDLAKLVYNYPDLGRKHLYRGTIKEWLKKTGDNQLLIEIADVTEYKYKNDEETGTKYAVYLLDRDYPYIGITNSNCSTKEQIIAELKTYFKEYTSLLQNLNHNLYLFLLAKGLNDEVEVFRNYFVTEDEQTALYKIIYSLGITINPNPTFNLQAGKKCHPIKNTKELSQLLIKDPTLGKGLEKNKEFRVWLFFKDKDALNNIDNVTKNRPNRISRLLPYIIDQDKGYTGLDGIECYILREIGEEIFNHINEYKKILTDPQSEIYSYFEAREYFGEVEYYNKVFDMEYASEKPATYNENIAICKVIQSTGFKMPYLSGNIKLSNPAELLKHYPKIRSEVKKELNDEQSLLNAWLSTFYHEDPLSDDQATYYYWRNDYDARLVKYVAYLEELDKSITTVKRYNEVMQKTNVFYDKYINYNKSVIYEMVIAFLFPLVASVLLITYSIVVKKNYLPGDIFEIEEWYLLIWAVGITGWFLWDGIKTGDFEFSTGCIGGPIVGAILGVIVYYIFYLIISFPLVVGVLLTILSIFLFNKMKSIKNECIYTIDKSQFNNERQESTQLAFKYAFSKMGKYEIPKTNNMVILESNKKLFRKRVWSLSIVVTLFISTVIYILITFNPNI